MTAKQIKFCDEYLISGNATDAAIKAGYSEKTAKAMGYENLTKPDCKKYIEERLNELHSQKIATAEEVMEYLTKGMRQELEEEVVMMDAGGIIQKTNKKISLKDSNKCAEMLAKRFGILVEKVNLNVEPVTITNDLVN